MKNYYLVTEWNPTGDITFQPLTANDETEAIKAAFHDWNHRTTPAERKRIRRLSICLASPEEVEAVAFDSFEGWQDIAEDGVVKIPEIGTTYEDPEGTFEVIAIDGDDVTVKNLTEGPNLGREYVVDIEEVQYFLSNK